MPTKRVFDYQEQNDSAEYGIDTSKSTLKLPFSTHMTPHNRLIINNDPLNISHLTAEE